MLSHRPVSLVMPTIGRMDFVDEAIASALNQSLPFDELLVFDNSQRQNLSELSGFGDDERVTWVRSGSFLGPIDSWNTAVGRARNDYVAILGDDDIALPNFHEEIQALLRRSDLGLVRMKWIDERGQEVLERAGIHKDLSPTEFRHQRIKQAIRSYLPGVVFCKQKFHSVGGFVDAHVPNYQFVDDLLWFKLSLLESTVAMGSTVGWCYRRSVQSLNNWSSLRGLSPAVDEYSHLLVNSLMKAGVPAAEIFPDALDRRSYVDQILAPAFKQLLGSLLRSKERNLLIYCRELCLYLGSDASVSGKVQGLLMLPHAAIKRGLRHVLGTRKRAVSA